MNLINSMPSKKLFVAVSFLAVTGVLFYLYLTDYPIDNLNGRTSWHSFIVSHQVNNINPINHIKKKIPVIPNQTYYDEASKCENERNHTVGKHMKDILVFGASSYIGSSIAIDLHNHNIGKIIPVDVGDNILSLTSLQYRNWERLSTNKLKPIFISNIEQTIAKMGQTVADVIYIPRNIVDGVLEDNIFNDEGTSSLSVLVSVLETVKHLNDNVRVTLITKSKRRNISIQSAWLQTLENSMRSYHYQYNIKIAFVRLDQVASEIQNNGRLLEQDDDKSDEQHLLTRIQDIVRNFDSSCIDIEAMSITRGSVTTVEKNIMQNNVVMSSYITTIQNPQYAITFPRNMFIFMQNWLISASRLGIHGVIFHDSLSEDFIRRVKENFGDMIEFQKISSFNGRTPNDYRFYTEYDYLKNHPEICNVILSDLRDITFYNDPFEVMEVIGSNMYVGIDVSYYLNSWSHSYPSSLIKYCYRREINSKTVNLDPFYNAGVIGGSRHMMLEFLKRTTESLSTTPEKTNCNMATITIVAHKFFRDQSFSGYPFQSAFKMDIPGPQGLAVKHKIENKKL